MPLAIRCRELKKTYPGKPPVEAVRGIDLDVDVGECFGVLGPNGAGKTTTIEILEGLLSPSSGEVEVLGERWDENADQIRNQIGISLQETRLIEKLSVRETLTLFRSFYQDGLEPEEAMARVSLEEKARAWVKNLSGGQKQRLAVATALVGNPSLLFLDEPTTGLDPASRRQLWEIISECGHQGRTVLLTTHYMDEAERLCDRVAIFDRGQVIAIGTPQELINGLGGEHLLEFSVAADGSETALVDESLLERWSGLPGVMSGRIDGPTFQLSVGEPHIVIPTLVQQVDEQNLRLLSLTTRHASLEDVFVSVAGRSIEQAEQEEAA